MLVLLRFVDTIRTRFDYKTNNTQTGALPRSWGHRLDHRHGWGVLGGEAARHRRGLDYESVAGSILVLVFRTVGSFHDRKPPSPFSLCLKPLMQFLITVCNRLFYFLPLRRCTARACPTAAAPFARRMGSCQCLRPPPSSSCSACPRGPALRTRRASCAPPREWRFCGAWPPTWPSRGPRAAPPWGLFPPTWASGRAPRTSPATPTWSER